MDPVVTGAAIVGGTSLLGAHISGKEAQRANAANIKNQERFAKHGITWKVADAKRAGISPEYALGAPTMSFAPSSTSSGKGDMIADAGQNIARSVLAAGSAEDRKLDNQLKAETLRGMTLDNDIKSTQFSTINNPGNPPFPHSRGNVIPGQGNSPVEDIPLQREGQHRVDRHSESGSGPDVRWVDTKDGGLRPLPAKFSKEGQEDLFLAERRWELENLVGPNLGRLNPPPKSALPKGAKFWRWSVSRQAYYPSKGKKSSALPPVEAYQFLRDKYRKHFGGK